MKILYFMILAMVLSACSTMRSQSQDYPAPNSGWNVNTSWVSKSDTGKDNSSDETATSQQLSDANDKEALIKAQQEHNEQAITAAEPYQFEVGY